MDKPIRTPFGLIGSGVVDTPDGLGPTTIGGRELPPSDPLAPESTSTLLGVFQIETPVSVRPADGTPDSGPVELHALTAHECLYLAPLTLRKAKERLEAAGGQIVAHADGTVAYLIPSNANPLRRRDLIHAALTLDCCRELTHAAVRSGIELPDLEAALGGGVAD